MSYATLLTEETQGVLLITLNRPDKMNALNHQLLLEMQDVLDKATTNEKVKVVIITGGSKFFAAGADIGQLRSFDSPLVAQDFLAAGHQVMNKIESMGKPVIAAVGGIAYGGGCEMTLACDFRLASEKALFGVPEVNLGLIPGWGGTVRLPRLIGATKAKEMLCTGKPVTANEAYNLGLVNKVVPQEALLDESKKFALELAEKPAQALRMAKAVVNNQFGLGIDMAIKFEAQCANYLFTTEDVAEGIRAFLEKRKPVFKGR
jgi:enoyl-CoA hydratase